MEKNTILKGLLTACLSMLAAGCHDSKTDNEAEPAIAIKFRASCEEEQFCFADTDKINVNGYTSTNVTFGNDNRLTADFGFQNMASYVQGPFHAFYPGKNVMTYRNGTFVISIPQEQPYTESGQFATANCPNNGDIRLNRRQHPTWNSVGV